MLQVLQKISGIYQNIFYSRKDIRLEALFGPQHGIHGQTQDNMIEWHSQRHPVYDIPLYSLYGKNRKPTSEMLNGIDAFIIDLAGCRCKVVYIYLDG